MLHQIITTEKVPVTYRVAGIGSRFLAWVVDCSVIVVLGLMGVLAASVLESGRSGLGMALGSLWIFTLKWGYFLFFEWLWVGQTPGKRLFHLRVLSLQGTGLTFIPSAIRNFLRVADALPVFYALGAVIASSDRLHRRLGDLAAGTFVVHLERKARAVLALAEEPEELDAATRTHLRRRIGNLDRPQKQALLDLCLRREQLPTRDRARLFRTAAEYVAYRLDTPRDPYQSDEKFLLQIAALIGERTPGDKP